jgi:hypothetical protein
MVLVITALISSLDGISSYGFIANHVTAKIVTKVIEVTLPLRISKNLCHPFHALSWTIALPWTFFSLDEEGYMLLPILPVVHI